MNECNTVKARESQAREWLLKGGGGHEGGADGLRALTVTGEGLVEFLAAYKEDFERPSQTAEVEKGAEEDTMGTKERARVSEEQVRDKLMHNDQLEQLILSNWKDGSNPSSTLNIPQLAIDIAALFATEQPKVTLTEELGKIANGLQDIWVRLANHDIDSTQAMLMISRTKEKVTALLQAEPAP